MFQPGTTIAGYRIDRLLGRGGMGEVYEATQMVLNRTVALKIISPTLTEDPRFRERFRREGRIQAQLEHPNIVTVHEAGESEHGLFIAMRFVRGPTLKELIVARQVDPQRAMRILGPVAEALDTAHGAGLVHRDVKPQNILVGEGDHAFLADFGLTKGTEDTSITETGQFVGTLDYIAPEQIHGQRPTDKSDIYAFGGVLYEALTGAVPYPKESQAAVLYAHIAERPPEVTRRRPDLPDGLDRVVARAMAKDPRDRYSAATPVIAEAEQILRTASQTPGLPPPVEAPEAVGVRRDEAEVTTEETRMALERMITPPREQTSADTDPLPLGERRARPRWLVPVALAGLLAVAAAALLGAASAQEPAKLARLSSPDGALSVLTPDSWTATERPPAIAGLDLSDVSASRADGSESAPSLMIGTARGAAPTFLPDSLLERLDPRPRGDVVRLNDVDAYRYRDLRPRAYGGRITVFAVPTTDRVAMVTCADPTAGADGFMRECERVAATLELPGKDPISLGTGDAYARVLSATFDELGGARADALDALGRARGLRGRERPADDIAAAYGRSRRAVVGSTPGPGAQQAHIRLVSALARAASEWRALASAARRGDRGDYNRAREAVMRAEGRLRDELLELRRLGFRVG